MNEEKRANERKNRKVRKLCKNAQLTWNTNSNEKGKIENKQKQIREDWEMRDA